MGAFGELLKERWGDPTIKFNSMKENNVAKHKVGDLLCCGNRKTGILFTHMSKSIPNKNRADTMEYSGIEVIVNMENKTYKNLNKPITCRFIDYNLSECNYVEIK